MAAVLKLVDEVVGATDEPARAFELRLVSEKITAAELIRRRVEQEVAEHNARPSRVFKGLVQPTDAESALGGARLRERRQLDAEAQVEVALEAFRSNGFFLLFDGRQVESLDEALVVTETSLARFVRLLPLVGG